MHFKKNGTFSIKWNFLPIGATQMAQITKIAQIALTVLMAAGLQSCAVTRLIAGSDQEDDREAGMERYQEQVKNAYTAGDLALGMQMRDVRNIWGEPSQTQWAGQPQEGNARWTYHNGLASQYSMSSAKVVYFEEGQVVGWETK